MWSRDRHRRAQPSVLALLALIVAVGGAPFGAAANASGGTDSAPRHNIGWQSGNWAGYVVDDGPYTSITGQWIAPTVSAGLTGYSAAWLGVDGVSNHRLIQVGTEHDFYAGRTHYWAWWEILPAPAVRITTLRIRPGDKITASIKRLSGKTWRITISDGAGTFTTTQTYSGPGTSAEWIVEAPTVGSRQTVLARHSPVPFDRLTVNGRNPHLTSDQGGALVQFRRRVATPSVPDAQGDGFTVRRQ